MEKEHGKDFLYFALLFILFIMTISAVLLMPIALMLGALVLLFYVWLDSD